MPNSDGSAAGQRMHSNKNNFEENTLKYGFPQSISF